MLHEGNLMEETGALRFDLDCVATYSVITDGVTGCGRLYLAEIFEMGMVPDLSEIAEICCLISFPETLHILIFSPFLFRKAWNSLRRRVKIDLSEGESQ